MLRLERSDLSRKGGATVESAVDALSIAETRIRSVAAIHGMMRLDENASRVDLDDLLDGLLYNTRQTVGIDEGALVLAGPRYGAFLDSDRAIALGLSVNELLTNAVKYGWSGTARRPITVTRGREDKMATLVMDNPILPEASGDLAIPSSGLGSELVDGFVAQIDGTLARETSPGRDRVTLRFPILT